MKKIFLFNILLCLVVTAVAKVFEYKGPDGHVLKYHVMDPEKDNWVSVFYYSDIDGKNPYKYDYVEIPATVNYKGKTYTVAQIRENAFLHCKIKKIVIPNTISRICRGAFGGCFELQEVHISDLVAWCKIIMEDESSNPLYSHDHIQLYLNNELITNLVIPDGVETITANFYRCEQLESVTIPQSVKSIGERAFSVCKNLRKVSIPTSLISIGDYAFAGCSSLSQIDLPSSVTELGVNAFAFCPLQILDIPNTVRVVGNGAFQQSKIKKLTIPQTIQVLGDDAFLNCENLEEVEINISGAIPKKAFGSCKNLKKVIIGPSVKIISTEAFYDCNVLTSVIIKNNPMLEIGNYAFNGCVALNSVQGLSEKNKVAPSAFKFNGMSHIGEKTPFSFEDYKKTFTFFALGKVEDAISQWQKKSEFETLEQWRKRVTTENRNAEVKKEIELVRQAYIDKMRGAEPTPLVQAYDAEKEVFPIKIGVETLYVKVPVDEAQQFKTNFKAEYIHTDYDIVNDLPAVVGRTCKVGFKVYATTNTYSQADNLDYLALNLPPLEMDFGSASTTVAATQPKAPTDLTIDQNIPTTTATNSNTFAVIIGNENYSLVAKVPYAKNDAQVLAEYCRKTLGLPAKNVRTYGDATYAMMMSAVKDIQDIANAYNGNINVIFYYAGHGIPDEQDKGAYLLPVDADGRQTSFCYPVSKLYQELGSMNVRSVVVLMDACFSGALRGDGMLMSARAVALKPKTETPQGKMVVMTAASGDETAYPYAEKGHGMFTYFLLKKLRDTKGNCTLGELSDYIQSNVKQQSVVINRKSQTPTVSSSTSVADSWKSMKLK